MLRLRPSHERGFTQTDWLDSWHSFSFGNYRDPKYRHFRALRVINQDIIQPGQGFGFHPHYDMEIITYVLRGSLAHRDSLGNEGIIHGGEVQRMSAGSGIMHSEFNPSKKQVVELLQIWILPAHKQLAPSYEQKKITSMTEPLQLLASPTGQANSLLIHQEVKLYRGLLKAGQSLSQDNIASGYFWLQQMSGQLQITEIAATLAPSALLDLAQTHQQLVYPGDGIAIQGAQLFTITALTDSEFLLFDLR